MVEFSTDYEVEVDDITREKWTQVILKFDDANIFQTWEYGAAKWGKDNLAHLVLKKSNEIVAAAQLWYVKFPIIGGGFAHVSMGPMWRPRGKEVNFDDIRNMVKALREEFVNRRGVLLRIYSYDKDDHIGKEIKQIFETEKLSRTKEPQDVTVLLNLSPDLDELRRNLRKSWRRQLSQAEKGDLKVIEGTDDQMFNSLSELYQRMLDRKKFTQYVANIKHLAEVQRELPQNLKMRTFLCKYNGEFVGGQAVSVIGNTGIDLIAAISDKDIDLKLKSTYLFEWHTIKWLKENGFQFLDLRGYDPDKYPGPSYYKAGLSGDIVSFLGIYECHDNLINSIIIGIGKSIKTASRYLKRLFKKSQNLFS
jgi:lipid II:glycine glycyltransferase (peptidoglycan interpeptide bridge formation enzyme)